MKKYIFSILVFLSFFYANTLSGQICEEEVAVTIRIHSDNWPSENSWVLSGLDSIYASVETGELTVGDSIYIWEYCLPDEDCLNFTINDVYGDGIDNTFDSLIGYTVLVNGVIVAQNAKFGPTESTMIYCREGWHCAFAEEIEEERIYTATHPNTYYLFVADTSGIYHISTCGLNDCDTKIWLYDFCINEIPPSDNTGALYYDDNEGGCGQAAQVNALLEAGDSIYIRIGTADMSCTDTIVWELNYLTAIAGCTDPNSCNYNALATIDDGSCLPMDDPDCPRGPDIEVQEDVFRNSLELDQVFAEEGNCFINEGCLNGYGIRDVIRFTTHFKNIGEFDYYLGEANEENNLFTYDNCHNHFHYESYAQYLLVDDNQNIVPVGHKAGFCVIDLECSGGGVAKFGCGDMGLTAGCGDIYHSNLDCQWIDVTDVEDGEYTIVMRVNWLDTPDANGQYEKEKFNNWATACVRLDRSSGSLAMEVIPECDTYVDCAGVPLGFSVYDCSGVCGGNNLMGDLDGNGVQELADAENYISQILGDDISGTGCNDLNNDEIVSVYDAALLNNCLRMRDIHDGNDTLSVVHEHCSFPSGSTNIFDTVALSIIAFNPIDNYVDIGIRNPNSKVSAYQFSLSGVVSTSVESLTDVDHPFSVEGNFNGEVIGITYPDSVLAKTDTFAPLCRVYFQELSDTLVCIASIQDIVNGQYEKTITNIEGECFGLPVSVKENIDKVQVWMQPNPMKEEGRLYINGRRNTNYQLRILNINGEVLHTYRNVQESIQIDAKDLPSGIYFYELEDGKNRHLGKLVIL